MMVFLAILLTFSGSPNGSFHGGASHGPSAFDGMSGPPSVTCQGCATIAPGNAPNGYDGMSGQPSVTGIH